MAYFVESQSESILMGIQQLEDLRDSLEGKNREVVECILLFADHVSAHRLARFITNAIEEIEDADVYTKLLQIAAYWNMEEQSALAE